MGISTHQYFQSTTTSLPYQQILLKPPNNPKNLQIKMQFSTVAITLFAALAAASPLERRQLGGLCGSALDTPQCCDVSVGGLADFQAECNGQGQAAYCCVLPILGDALVCTAL